MDIYELYEYNYKNATEKEIFTAFIDCAKVPNLIYWPFIKTKLFM